MTSKIDLLCNCCKVISWFNNVFLCSTIDYIYLLPGIWNYSAQCNSNHAFQITHLCCWLFLYTVHFSWLIWLKYLLCFIVCWVEVWNTRSLKMSGIFGLVLVCVCNLLYNPTCKCCIFCVHFNVSVNVFIWWRTRISFASLG